MNPNDRQRIKVLVILLAVFAATVWVGRQIYRVPEPFASGPANTANLDDADSSFARAAVAVDMEDIHGAQPFDDGDRRNPFDYGPEPPPPPVASAVGLEGPDSLEGENPADSRPAPAPPPSNPPPPPIPFRYSGYATVGPSGEAMALLFDDDQSFAVVSGEVLMGRYRINELTETFVEVEDLEYGRRQRLPLIVQ